MPKILWFPANTIKKMKLTASGRSAFEHIDRYDWILFTSKNTVRFFAQEMKARRFRILPRTKIAAVGPETARALKSAGKSSGLKIDLMPKQFSSDNLVSALGARVAGKRILFPRSAIASPRPVRKLRENGARVDVVRLYTSIAPRIPRDIAASIKKGAFKYIVFTSPSMVDFFAERFMKKMSQDMKSDSLKLHDISAVCIGPSTATAARVFPFAKIHTAKVATKAGIKTLLRALP